MAEEIDIDVDPVQGIETTFNHCQGFNNSNNFTLPDNMKYTEANQISIICYTSLFIFSAVANSTVLILIGKRRRRNPTRINTLLIHLAMADLLVTFLVMPLEIGWNSTVSWKAGDTLCRICSFFRTFGLYLSSFVLICISLDRFYAILKPLHLAHQDRREKFMLCSAWVGAAICSFPQILIFHVETHPCVPTYDQCVSFHSFPSRTHEMIYLMFGMIMMYAIPLAVIIYSYSAILMEIFRRTKNPSSADSITRSSFSFLSRAKIRTLKMTSVIVIVFFLCWTPYYIMSLWYWFDHPSARKVDERIQKILFLFACTNSCMNPVVYGIFNVRPQRRAVKREVRRRHDPSPLNSYNTYVTRLSSIKIGGANIVQLGTTRETSCQD